MLTQAKLGDRIPYKDKVWTVVRIVQSSSLHTNGDAHVIMENFLEMHTDDGDIEFYVISSQKMPYVGQQPPKGLPTLPWRKEKVSE